MVFRIVLNGTNRFCFTTPSTATLVDPTGGATTVATNAYPGTNAVT